MRISAELLSIVEQRTNPLGERELVLCGLGIPLIENIAAATDSYDTYNMSNNRIVRLENFPRLLRLSNLLLGNNLIESIDSKNLSRNIPNIISLTLSYNHISSLVEISNISKAFPKLEFLSLDNNPVTRRQYYRLYTIHCIPTLKTLDYQKVRVKERTTSVRLMKSSAGAALEQDVQHERQHGMGDVRQIITPTNDTAKTFIPGEGIPDVVDDDTEMDNEFENPNKSSGTIFTDEQKEQIRTLLANASSVQEVEEIEAAVRKGILPEKLRKHL